MAGLSKETGERIVFERANGAFEGLADFAKRVAPKRNEIDALAECGALASIDPAAPTRRSAIWQVAAVERDPQSLFAGTKPVGSEVPSPLDELTPLETTLADYRTTGLTTGPHVLGHLRPELDARGVLPARALCALPNGRFVRTAGHVIVRQRPGSAKGFCFLTLEDETGTSNAVLTPDVFARLRIPLHASPLLEVAGVVQNVDGVIHVKVGNIRPLAMETEVKAPRGGGRNSRGKGYGSHDYH